MNKYLFFSGKLFLVIMAFIGLLFLYTAFKGYFLKKEANIFAGALLQEISKDWDLGVIHNKVGDIGKEYSAQKIKEAGDALGKVGKCKTKKADINVRVFYETTGVIKNLYDCSFERGQAAVIIDLTKNRDGSWLVNEFQLLPRQ